MIDYLGVRPVFFGADPICVQFSDRVASQSDWSHLRDDPRLGVSQMAHYLTLFWVKVHETQAPAVHRASFRPSSTQTPLLLSMMLLGSYFAPPESYQLAVQLHPWFRGKVLCVSLPPLSSCP